MSATFLDIAKNASIEAGIPGTGLASVENNDGINLKIVKWVNDAWAEIQALHFEKWRFMRGVGTFAVTSAQENYNLQEINAPDLHRFKDDTILHSDGTPITVIDSQEWFERGYMLSTEVGKPKYALLTSEALKFYPRSDQNYALSYVYYRSPQVLSENNDLLLCNKHYAEKAVEYLAAFKYASFQEDEVKMGTTMRNHKMWLDKMSYYELPTAGGFA